MKISAVWSQGVSGLERSGSPETSVPLGIVSGFPERMNGQWGSRCTVLAPQIPKHRGVALWFVIALIAVSAACFAAPSVSKPRNYSGEMIFIPAGSFLMGNSGAGDDATEAQQEELPRHSVILGGYYIGKYEVTRGEYRKFIDAGGYANQAFWSKDGWQWKTSGKRAQPDYWAENQNWGTGEFAQADSHPVVGVSYYEAEAFCKWAGGHLPTEAQWEKAARWNGKSANVYPWGNTWDREKCNNYLDKNPAGGYGLFRTTPVGSYPDGASPYGCVDMAGNAREWCQDWYKSYPKSAKPFDFTNVYRVLRGGGWYYNPGDGANKGDRFNYCRSGYRGSDRLPYGSNYDYGFRMAAGAPGAGAWAVEVKAKPISIKTGASKGRVIYNLDCSEMFMGKFGPAVPETIDKFVDDHAAAGVTDLFINVNAQRVNYHSSAWESYWDGYDPDAGDKQPFFEGIDFVNRPWDTLFYINTYLIYKQGCDYPRRMIDRARRDGVRPWISFRMNDAEESHIPHYPGHSTFWESHPDWRLSSGGLDYGRPEVRDYYLKLIMEVCSRYDVDGIELDYQRTSPYFLPGREHDGAELMTAFVEQARTATREAAKRLKHPVKLAVRVQSTPWIARRNGLEAVYWAKTGLVDLIIVSPFWPSINGDMPIETWKGMLIGTKVPVAFGLEGGMQAGTSGYRVSTPEEVRGAALSGLHRGADDIYFFNLFTNPLSAWPRPDYYSVLRDAGSYTTLAFQPRRHPVTITIPWATGEPGPQASFVYGILSASALPYSGNSGVFRTHIGPKPTQTQRAQVELVTANDEQRPDVKVNGIPCPWSRLAEPEHITAAGWKGPEAKRQVYDIPTNLLADGYNLIEVSAKEPIMLMWVEISVR